MPTIDVATGQVPRAVDDAGAIARDGVGEIKRGVAWWFSSMAQRSRLTQRAASKPSSAPDGWWLGLAITLAVGITVSAYVSAFIYDLVYAVINGSIPRALYSVLGAFTGMILTLPITLIVGTIPITISYIALRRIAPYVEMTVPRRIGIGLALGTAANMLCLFIDYPYDSTTQQSGLMASGPTFFPYIEIQASALVLALVARARWFGVAAVPR